MEALKTCCRCHKILPATSDYFYKNCGSKDGLAYECKDCSRIYNQNHQATIEQLKGYFTKAPDFKIINCQKCGKEFSVPKSDKGYFYLKRKFCDECSQAPQVKVVNCLKCGAEITLTRSKATNNFSQQRYCDKCLSRAETKELTCVKCGKIFTVGRTPSGTSFKYRKYCSDCLIDNHETKTVVCQICGKEFETHRSKTDNRFLKRKCCDPCFYTSTTSIPEKKFMQLLDSHNIEYEKEYCINQSYYDFHIKNTNIVIEINPSFTHSVDFNGLMDGKPISYHRDKSKLAELNGYICICVWDWTDWSDVINMIKNANKLEMVEKEVELHYYTRNHIHSLVEIDNAIPVYDDGYKIVIK